MAITGGEISFGRTVNIGDYNSKKAEAKIGFTVEDGTTADDAGNMAVAVVTKLLGMKAGGAAAEAALKTAATHPVDAADDAKAAHAAKHGSDATKPAAKAKAPKAKPAAKPDVDAVDETPPETQANISTGGERIDPAEADEFQAEPPTITDADLKTACGRKNVELIKALGDEGPKKLRHLIAEFVTHPGGVADIPMTLRQKFLDKLADLKA